jgi:hypothetical protein
MSSKYFNGGSAVKRVFYNNSSDNGIVGSLFWEFYNSQNIIKPISDREVYISNRLTVYDLNILSDERHKQRVQDLSQSDCKYLKLLRPKKYIMNQQNHYGFIAQEVEKIYPHLVNTSIHGEKSIKYHELIPLMLIEIQSLEKRIAVLEGSSGRSNPK